MLIYDQEKRWTGLSKAEHAARSANTRAFGKEFAGTIKGRREKSGRGFQHRLSRAPASGPWEFYPAVD